MKDYTTIIKDDIKKVFRVTRELSDEITQEDLKEQISKLEHKKEVMEDELEAIEVRLKLLKEASSKGKAEGDTTLPGIKMPL